ncbi:endonuclease/exonuclease/phosphatase [Leptotrichia trevisanii]|uniref:Endonuclease/exonuclease/phosphatase n=1 Tax=Leptotrichia trevisanii TaxID=109328 RepID=A0A510KM85_9FUSO|nr:endonuclease/exonuclease/phosphatase family protein [Leptotrichia trevisanii]BBM52808.1 endonuclease/exonuclease/phosphatase [Leptotrichia trevisanii]
MEFRIMTYNIFGARLADGKKLAQSVKKYKPDFIALQEVDKNTKRSNFRDVTQDFALELGYNYYYFQKAMDFDKGEFGIAFVSKYDVKNIYVHELPSAGNEKRQVLAAQINSSKYKKHILVINTHLDYEPIVKSTQIDNLMTVVDYFKGDVKILCGDFNLLPTTEYYQKIIENWNDTYFEGKDLENESDVENRNLETQRIDYVMVKKGGDYRTKESFFVNDNSQEWTKLSDHLPYVAVLEIE